MTAPFEPRRGDADALRLIADHPLAWLVSRAFHASPLPLIAETDASGAILSLLGHCGRRNPLVADLRADPRALILFNGPQGYVSPSLLSQPDWAPTWNYAVLRFTVDVTFVEDETSGAVERLVAAMEGDRWSTDRVGPRYPAMLDRIIAFRARIVSADPGFKLGQDESAAGLDEIVARHPDRALAAWMEDQAKP